MRIFHDTLLREKEEEEGREAKEERVRERERETKKGGENKRTKETVENEHLFNWRE